MHYPARNDVLVAEDNDLNMEIVEYMLERNGIQVVCAKDGQEVIDLFEKSEVNEFDFILMDIMMPKINGLDATRKIRALKRLDAKTIPIIAMSANAFVEDIMNLNKAVNSTEETPDSTIKSLMEKYISLSKKEFEIMDDMFGKMNSILPVKKAAKLISAEEKFREQLIRQLKEKKD